MKKFTLPALMALALAFCASCAKDIVVEEALQLPVHATVRTAYNIWYNDSMEVESINYLSGSILPFGTEVVITRATEKEIFFHTVADNRQFRIRFNKDHRMQTAREYIQTLFTADDVETITEDISPANVEKIRRGIVEKGMTKKEVSLAYGPPCRFKTPSETLDTWLFWTEFLISRRIIFNGGRVVEILVL